MQAMSILSSLPQPCKRWLRGKYFELRGSFVRTCLSYGPGRLLACLRDLGVRSGDSVMLHSGSLGEPGFSGTVAQLDDVFVEAVGREGHLLMVSLPYRTSSQQYLSTLKRFDVRTAPSMMGLMSESFRRRPGVLRSLHPTHPTLVLGPRAEWFVAEHPDCLYPCGPGTPFDKLASVDGKAVFFNVPFATYTFSHYLEHLVAPHLPFSLYTQEAFEVPVIDRHGNARMVTTYAFAQQAIELRRFDALETELRRRGLIARRRIGNSRIELVRVRDTIDCTMEMASRGEFFFSIKKELRT